MRTSNINVRVEPEIARGLTWATNKYNFENCKNFTKTDIIELLVRAILTEPNFLKYADTLVNGTDLGFQASYVEWLEARDKEKKNSDYGKEVTSHGKED